MNHELESKAELDTCDDALMAFRELGYGPSRLGLRKIPRTPEDYDVTWRVVRRPSGLAIEVLVESNVQQRGGLNRVVIHSITDDMPMAYVIFALVNAVAKPRRR